VNMNMTFGEYTAIYNFVYRGGVKKNHEATFRRMFREANAIVRQTVAPHSCVRELREVQRDGETVTVEVRR